MRDGTKFYQNLTKTAFRKSCAKSRISNLLQLVKKYFLYILVKFLENKFLKKT
jgi:hypothetical protein